MSELFVFDESYITCSPVFLDHTRMRFKLVVSCCCCSKVISSCCFVQDQLAVEKHAAEHQTFIFSYHEVMTWLEYCRQQLANSDVTKDTIDHWVCMLYLYYV